MDSISDSRPPACVRGGRPLGRSIGFPCVLGVVRAPATGRRRARSRRRRGPDGRASLVEGALRGVRLPRSRREARAARAGGRLAGPVRRRSRTTSAATPTTSTRRPPPSSTAARRAYARRVRPAARGRSAARVDRRALSPRRERRLDRVRRRRHRARRGRARPDRDEGRSRPSSAASTSPTPRASSAGGGSTRRRRALGLRSGRARRGRASTPTRTRSRDARPAHRAVRVARLRSARACRSTIRPRPSTRRRGSTRASPRSGSTCCASSPGRRARRTTATRSSRTHDHRPGGRRSAARGPCAAGSATCSAAAVEPAEAPRPVEPARPRDAPRRVVRARSRGPSVLRRPVPSAGALYPLEALRRCASPSTGLEPGVYHYDPFRHRLALLGPLPFAAPARGARRSGAGSTPRLRSWSSRRVFWRSRFKYGLRGYRFALLEAGHLVQNAVLAATDLDAGRAAGRRLLRRACSTGSSERTGSTRRRCTRSRSRGRGEVDARCSGSPSASRWPWRCSCFSLRRRRPGGSAPGLLRSPAPPAGSACTWRVARHRPYVPPLVPAALAACAVLVVSAASEEVVWRRVVLGELLRAGPLAALAGSTLGFALVHRTRQGLHLGTGAAFGGLYLATGALAAAIAAHSSYNVLLLMLAEHRSRRAGAP